MKLGEVTGPMILRSTCGSRNSSTQLISWRRSSTRLVRRKCPRLGSEQRRFQFERRSAVEHTIHHTNYHSFRLVSHNVEIFERIVDRRILNLVQPSTSQFSYVTGCGTIDVIHAAGRDTTWKEDAAAPSLSRPRTSIWTSTVWWGNGIPCVSTDDEFPKNS